MILKKSNKKKVKSSAIKTNNRMDFNTISTARVTTKQEVVICLLTRAIPDLSKNKPFLDMRGKLQGSTEIATFKSLSKQI